MKILITGANGFIGKNLKSILAEQEGIELLTYDGNTGKELLKQYCSVCDFVYHLAGINRSDNINDFYTGNIGFTKELMELLTNQENPSPILYTSSIHAIYDNPYGRSKKACEELIKEHEEKYKSCSYVYRLPNLFGKWSRPNYNSVVATFCNNISKGLPIHISDPDISLHLAYIDDVVKEFLQALTGNASIGKDGYYTIPEIHNASLGYIAELIYSFKEGYIPENRNSFENKLYHTYLSY
ncbi:MAG: NAD-dependent epimerase/dehydratase family protein [Anaerocolumna sp.]